VGCASGPSLGGGVGGAAQGGSGTTSDEEAKAAAARSEGSLSARWRALNEGEELSFDWETAPLSELLAYCAQFQNPAWAGTAPSGF